MKAAIIISCFALCCLQLFAASAEASPNLALKRPAYESSQFTRNRRFAQFTGAGSAVDGNTASRLAENSCSMTDAGDRNPWWAVDLGKPTDVGTVTITGRRDCCAARLNKMTIGLTNTDPRTVRPSLSNVVVCTKGPRVFRLGQTLAMECRPSLQPARYVVILSEIPFLTLCEVAVYERKEPKNLALKKPTWESSVFRSRRLKPYSGPERAVDGNRSPVPAEHSCSRTDIGDRNPWWAVDLGQPTIVETVVVSSQQFCCFIRLNRIVVGLTNVAPNVRAPNFANVDFCANGPAKFPRGTSVPLKCLPNLAPARYVVILSHLPQLTMCEVEVYGTKAQLTCANSPCKNGGTCSATSTGGYSCTCPPSWLGDDCTTESVDPCKPNPCKNGGKCSSDSSSSKFSCSCVIGWSGDDCTTDVNVCKVSNPCKNGGTCVKFGTSFACKCPPNWAGKTCEMGASACKAVEPSERVNCGWGGITPEECSKQGCCFDNTVRGRPYCFYSDYKCDEMTDSETVDCGWEGITYPQCINRGCCFNDDEETNNGIVCSRRENPDCVGVEAADRVARGDDGIQPNECNAQDWCFDTNGDSDEKLWCFTRA